MVYKLCTIQTAPCSQGMVFQNIVAMNYILLLVKYTKLMSG